MPVKPVVLTLPETPLSSAMTILPSPFAWVATAGTSWSPVSDTATSVAPAATFSQAVKPATVSFTVAGPGGNVAGTVAFNSADTVATFTPAGPLAGSTTYTATVSGAQNSSGTAMSSAFAWSFTTGAAVTCPCSVWQDGTPTGSVDENDPAAQTVGVRFQASGSGFITGVRFYKESDNTGAHIGSLWSSSGTLLASGTFSSETASGWQELDFSAPVAVTAGTTYVASYFTSTGHYAYTAAGLASAGAGVAIWGTNPEKNARAAAELRATGGTITSREVDVSD